MSCIATSVGLGNVWRFPFVAYQNGGGAFLFPYLLVLFLVGKPMYYLECMIGQFSSRNCVTIWEMCPAMKGTGYVQAMGTGYILSYYVAIVAICMYYLVFSFRKTLPWAVCDKSWTDVICVPSHRAGHIENFENATSSAELYFLRTVLNQPQNIDNGIGYPIWYLVLFLLLAWVIIFLIVARGVKSSGKASYFLAIFPYVVMLILLITTCTLKGAANGMLFFLTPQWDKLYDLEVWYAAVTQVFFSLTVCTGAIIMFSSYNGFRHNVYRDSLIVTTLDTFTSLLSGITIFGIMGNLAHVLQRPVKEVVGTGGTGLAFISYPDSIAKTAVPQLFSVLFFLMMVVLGVGSAVALLLAINTVLIDSFPRVGTVYMSALCCTVGFLVGIVYLTPGGQWILGLVDHFGGTFLVLFTGMSEIIGVMWFYGLENVCLDVEFMLGKGTCFFWRWCWAILTPAMMIVVFIFALFNNTLDFGDQPYPFAALACGYAMLIIGMLLVPLFIGKRMCQHRTGNCCETLKLAFRTTPSWGPKDETTKEQWKRFKAQAKADLVSLQPAKCKRIGLILVGGYRNV
ncbi:sodium-dependent nutrient amino acid transporter 1-like [Cydia strobilella]|uniref:sodium-dependent nutrient amino acid transporter 1-like n=1 Tax=Cydia strobilella TaxID=1100964 RepID=UPI0030048FB3